MLGPNSTFNISFQETLLLLIHSIVFMQMCKMLPHAIFQDRMHSRPKGRVCRIVCRPCLAMYMREVYASPRLVTFSGKLNRLFSFPFLGAETGSDCREKKEDF